MTSITTICKGGDVNNYSSMKNDIETSNINFRNNINYNFPSMVFTKISKNEGKLCVSDDGDVYMWHTEKTQEKNDGDSKGVRIRGLRKINDLKNIKMIDCGSNHFMCLDCDGNVFTFGFNEEGQLGIGKSRDDISHTFIPQKIKVPPCKQVSCGMKFSFCLTEEGRLYSFGTNRNRYLGLENNSLESYNSPQLITNVNNVEYIACGHFHSICKTYDNKYYSCGDNRCGQLGHGDNMYGYGFIQCHNWPDNIISIRCGLVHSLLLTSEGYIYSFGFNGTGQLGINDKNIESTNIPTLIRDVPEMKSIYCGYCYSACIDVNDNMWVFGSNDSGQLGLGDKENRYKPVLQPTLSNVIDISLGTYTTFVKTQYNKIYAFGGNREFQLESKTPKKRQLTPIQTFIGNEDIWSSSTRKSKQKSARK